jgi:hypothetical protein
MFHHHKVGLIGVVLSLAYLQPAAQTPKSKANPKPVNDTKTVSDTIVRGWVKSYDEKVLSHTLRVDGKGIFYVLKETPNGKRLFRISDDKWEDIQKDIADPRLLITDDKGNIYLVTNNAGYKINSTGLEQTWKQTDIYAIQFGKDGNLYGDIADPRKAGRRFVVKYELGKWNYIGNEHFLSDKYFTVIDKDGNIYLADNISDTRTKNFRLRKWTKSTGAWSQLSTDMGAIGFLGIDKYNTIYLQQYNQNTSGWELKKWEPGWGWERIPLPETIHRWYLETKLVNDEIYIKSPLLENENESIIYRLAKGKWIREAKWTGKLGMESFSTFLTSGRKLLLATRDSIYQFDKTPISITSRNLIALEPVPLEGISSSTPTIGGSYNKIGLFQEKGKWGLKNRSGTVLIFPLFDAITITKSPSRFYYDETHDYAFKLKSGDTAIYCSYSFGYMPDQLEGFISKMLPCNRCFGSGKLPDRKEEILVKGKWVNDKGTSNVKYQPKTSVERTWNSATRQYVDVVTTTHTYSQSNSGSGGHYEKDTYKTETIKGGVCDVCKGKPYMISREVYVYNPVTSNYELTLVIKADTKDKYK